jgi:phosphoribosylformimino-5-aminoimidazole carboxamide ribotide isomerase
MSMIIYPVIEIVHGKCRSVEEGRVDRELFPSSDLADIMRVLLDMGANGICLIDVDAATGKGSNFKVIDQLIEKFNYNCLFVGGGIRDSKLADKILMAGAAKLIIGTGAIEDLSFLQNLSDTYSKSFIYNLDINGTQVYTHGRGKLSPKNITHAIQQLGDVDVGGIMLTFVNNVSELDYIDPVRMRWLESVASVEFQAHGRVRDMDHIKEIATASTEGLFLSDEIFLKKYKIAEAIEI